VKKIKKYILGIFFVLLICLTGCNSERITEEERAEYEAARTHEYKVVSVYQYMKVTRRNYFGTPSKEEIRYCFTYIGDDGQLHEFKDFENTEYGLWKICIGDQNKYVIKEDVLDTYRYLCLTAETLNNIEVIKNQKLTDKELK